MKRNHLRVRQWLNHATSLETRLLVGAGIMVFSFQNCAGGEGLVTLASNEEILLENDIREPSSERFEESQSEDSNSDILKDDVPEEDDTESEETPTALKATAATTVPLSSQNVCTAAKMKEILDEASTSAKTVVVTCNLNLKKSDRVTKTLVIRGKAASNITINCNGATLDEGTINKGKDMIYVVSRKTVTNGVAAWDRPENVTIKNCVVRGAIRVSGMATNGEGEDLKISSRTAGHTQRAQANAPKNITLQNLKIIASSRIPVYFSPGVTYSSLLTSEVSGKVSSTVIYLDAESAYNTIKGNNIRAQTESREVMAIDGSAYNKIMGNIFSGLNNGGIYLYRNCGEGGTVRHQSPLVNQIINNAFYYDKYKGGNPSIFVASRNGNRKYCNDDSGYPFGSSVNNKDLVKDTVIAQNQIYKLSPSTMIRLDDSPNHVYSNVTVSSHVTRQSGCFVKGAYPSPVFNHGAVVTQILQNGVPTCTGKSYTCNDGLVTTGTVSCSNVPVPKVVDFACQVSGNNNGCSGTVRCPGTTRIVSAKAACNLEAGSVSTAQINGVASNTLSVVRVSDNARDGVCRMDTANIYQGSASLTFLRGGSSANFSCREYDKNGGDCHIRGSISCL